MGFRLSKKVKSPCAITNYLVHTFVRAFYRTPLDGKSDVSDQDVLSGLDSVNWESLKHAYGDAYDVPDLLRSLLSEDAQERHAAYNSLYGTIYHQGTRYSATAHAVPFLLRMLDNSLTLERDSLITLLIHLAVGDASDLLPDGTNLH